MALSCTSNGTLQSVLIHAAAGGVGIAAVQIAQAVGAEVRSLYITGYIDV